MSTPDFSTIGKLFRQSPPPFGQIADQFDPPIVSVPKSTDFSLLGYIKCPLDGDPNAKYNYSWLGEATGLMVRGSGTSKTFLMYGYPPQVGNPIDGNSLIEFTWVSPQMDITQATRAKLETVYPRPLTMPLTVPQASGFVSPGAATLSPSGNVITPWAGFYNVAAADTPCLSLSDFNGNSWGPWFTQAGSRQCRGYALFAPDYFANQYLNGYNLLVGSGLTAGNAVCSWGPGLVSVQAFLNGVLPNSVLPTKYLSFYPIGNKCLRPDYIIGRSGYPPNTVVTNSNLWSESDFVYCAGWLKTPTKEGVLFFGNVAAPGATIWYGNGTNDPTAPGLIDPVNPLSRGDHSTAYVPRAWIYDPKDFASVLSGAKQSWEINPVEVFDPSVVWNLPMIQSGFVNGACQDPDDPTVWYLNIGNIEKISTYQYSPIIAVVKVN